MTEIVCLTLGDFGVNTYLFNTKDGICIIDPGEKADIIIKNVVSFQEKLSISKDCKIHIFLTHGHLDHVGAIQKLKDAFSNSQIFINKKDEKCLGEGSYNFQYEDFARSGMEFFVEKILPNQENLPNADRFYADLDFLFDDWQVLETPGHTKGSSCLYNSKEKILFSGDTLFWNSYGRTDLFGGSDIQMIESLKKLLALPEDVRVFPGHGKCGFKLSELSF